MPKKSNFCLHCGRTEEEHCTFEAISTPDNCRCDARDWNNPRDIPVVCAAFINDPKQGWCQTCQHLRECHVS